MPSSFFGLHVAYSGLNAAQASINTTANNISNVQTKGYSKQTVNLSAAAALRSYQRFGSTGTGVAVDSVTQLRDEYYDVKYWNNQAGKGLYEKKLYYMEQIQNYYTDGSLSATSNAGFSTIFSKMFNALDNLKSKAGDSSARNEFISDAQELCTYFNSTAQRMQDLQSSVNDEIKTTVDNINAIAQKISLLNKQINIIEMEKGHAFDLFGQLYEQMFLLKSKASANGQFFTPDSLCRLMADITDHVNEENDTKNGFIWVNDPACGSARTLLAHFMAKTSIDHALAGRYFYEAADIDLTTCKMAACNMMIHGMQGRVVCQDQLALPTPTAIFYINEVRYPFPSDMYSIRVVYPKKEEEQAR